MEDQQQFGSLDDDGNSLADIAAAAAADPPAAKRLSVDQGGDKRNSTFENSSVGNNHMSTLSSQHLRTSSASSSSSGSNKPKGIVYKKADRNALSESLCHLFQNEILTDLSVIVDEKEEIRAHKAILASQSPYLRKLIQEAEFKQDLSIDAIGFDEPLLTIVLDGISYDIAEKIIGFMYSGKIVLTDNNVIDVFLTSNLMNIVELKQKCEEHVSSYISCDSLQVLLQAARTHHAKELEKRCISFFQNNAEAVLQSEAFLEVSESILVDLLCKDFYIPNELLVFDFVLKWGKTKRRNLSMQSKANGSIPSVQDLVVQPMRYVRLISMPKSALESRVAYSEVVDEDLLLEVLFRKLQTGLVYSAGETYESPDALDSQGNPVKFYLKARRGTWKKLVDFPSETEYSEYMKSVLRPGMLLRAVNTYEQVHQGDVGEFVQFNAGIPPCQVRWQIYGNTYWLFWRDLEIV
eukprot:TRINITY_DN27640_c0_g1_i1.p1 TRINITY_DN27640_c0_g1~~TRINITY_DN27640_c0_g1_i1.p1  ORF type:complete len:464 (-),score=116.82 TRINITY_DN27640_c0_g1_i1:82-1473(-)